MNMLYYIFVNLLSSNEEVILYICKSIIQIVVKCSGVGANWRERGAKLIRNLNSPALKKGFGNGYVQLCK